MASTMSVSRRGSVTSLATNALTTNTVRDTRAGRPTELMTHGAPVVAVTGERPAGFGVPVEVQPGEALDPPPSGQFGVNVGVRRAEVGEHASRMRTGPLARMVVFAGLG
jgi:hypothetical protein